MGQYHLNYNQAAAAYGQHRKIHPGVFQNLLEYGNLSANTTVLEVGCGTGNYCTAIHDKIGCPCYGIEPAEGMLAQAKAKSETVNFQIGQAEKLNFPAHMFDLIYSVDVIHHVLDRKAFYREAFRTLNFGGRLCTVTDSAAVIKRRQPLSTYFPETVPLELDRYPRLPVLHTFMTAAGFSQIQELEVEFSYSLTDSQPYRDKAFSSLHLISEKAWQEGLNRLESDLRKGPIKALSLYTLLWGTKHEPTTTS